MPFNQRAIFDSAVVVAAAWLCKTAAQAKLEQYARLERGNSMWWKALALSVLGTCASACTAVTVYQDDGKSVDGIPFNAKIPVEYQTAKWSLRSVTIALKIKGKQGGEDFSWDIPPSPLLVPQTAAVMTEVRTLQMLANAGKDEALYAQLLQVQRVGEADMDAAQKGSESSAMRLLANARSVEVEVSPHQYFLSPRMPLVGSSQYELGLNDKDGTMSKASGTVKDDTVTTLASLIPINAYFSKQLGLNSAKATKLTALAGQQEMAITDATLVLDISASSAIYTLRKRLNNTDCKWGLPPTIADSAKAGCVERLATEMTASSTPPKKEKDKPGYEITGKITLPEQKP